MTPQCAELVMKKTLCIYLKASVDTLKKRLASETESRPLLDSNTSSSMQNRIEDLLAQRSTTYENTARITIDTDSKSIEEIAASLAAAVSAEQ